jgi:hypothetical protein
LTQAKRYLLVALSCLTASLLNPYGIEEHRHLTSYLSAGWIREMVEEFQSPSFQKGEMIYFEVLLAAGLLISARLLARREFARALLVLAWAHASLTSVRHVPIFAIVCAPVLARELTLLRDTWIASGQSTSFARVFHSIGSDYMPALSRTSIWATAAIVLLLLAPISAERFVLSGEKVPSKLIERRADIISASNIFTIDGWADYLTFRSYPKQKIFVDGRSDFFGEELSREYLQVLHGQSGWEQVLQRFGVDLVLVPPQSSIATVLRLQPHWRLVDESESASLFSAVREEHTASVDPHLVKVR